MKRTDSELAPVEGDSGEAVVAPTEVVAPVEASEAKAETQNPAAPVPRRETVNDWPKTPGFVNTIPREGYKHPGRMATNLALLATGGTLGLAAGGEVIMTRAVGPAAAIEIICEVGAIASAAVVGSRFIKKKNGWRGKS